MSGQVLKSLQQKDGELLKTILDEAFGSLEYLPRVGADLSRMDTGQEAFFLVEEDGSPIGCIAATSLPRENWYNLRFLAVKNAFSNTEAAEKLVKRALEHVESRGYEYLKATTPAVQPYVDTYKRFNFTPVRRTLRLAWDLTATSRKAKRKTEVKALSKQDEPNVEKMIKQGHLPYWDWWFEERGGTARSNWASEFGFPTGNWLGTVHNEKISGLTGVSPNYYGQGEARLECFCVLPEFRGRGVGTALLAETLDRAKLAGQRRLVIYTFAYLDSLPPGAVTYLKSGAKIEGEYLQLQKL